MALSWDDPKGPPHRVNLEFFCPGAQEIKVSNDPDFPGAEWKPWQSSIRWTLGDDQVATVFVAFKKRQPEGKGARVTPVTSYTLDKKDTPKKIERFGKHGYLDWTRGELVVFATATVESKESRHGSANSQALAEAQLADNAYQCAVRIQVEAGLSLGELLKLEPSLGSTLTTHLQSLRLTDISQPTSVSTKLEGRLSLTADKTGKRVPGFFPFSKPLRQKPIPKIPTQWDQTYDLLIIDVRGFRYEPSLFPQIRADDGRTLVAASRTTNRTAGYVRYLRSLDPQGNLPWGSLGFVKVPAERQLFVKAIGLDANEPGAILVSRRHERQIHGNEASLDRFCNGGLILLTD